MVCGWYEAWDCFIYPMIGSTDGYLGHKSEAIIRWIVFGKPEQETNVVLWKWSESGSVVSTLCDPMDYPWNSLGQNTGVGSLSLLQGILPTQELNRGLLHCRRILYQLSYQGSPLWFCRSRIMWPSQWNIYKWLGQTPEKVSAAVRIQWTYPDVTRGSMWLIC